MATLVGLVLTVIVELLNSEPKSRYPLIDYLIKEDAGRQTGYGSVPGRLGNATPMDGRGKQAMH